MEIRQLKYFVEVARRGSFSEASRVCYLSQSAISQQIKALEDEYGTQLFVRTPHKVLLTESGQRLLPYAKKVLRDVSDCSDCLENAKEELSGELNVGLTFSLEPFMRNTAVEYLKRYPKMKLNVYYKTTPELMLMLREQKIDIAFSISCDGYDELFESEQVFQYRLCAVVRSIHPWANRKELALADLPNQQMVLPEPESFVHSVAERYLHTDMGDLNVRATVNDPSSILRLISHTDYMSIMSEQSVKGLRDFRAIPIKELSEPVGSYVHWLKNSVHKHSGYVLLEMIKENIKMMEQIG